MRVEYGEGLVPARKLTHGQCFECEAESYMVILWAESEPLPGDERRWAVRLNDGLIRPFGMDFYVKPRPDLCVVSRKEGDRG